MPVCVLVAVIVTPGIKAPLESDTVPPKVAFVVCAKPRVKNKRQNKAAAEIRLVIVFLRNVAVILRRMGHGRKFLRSLTKWAADGADSATSCIGKVQISFGVYSDSAAEQAHSG